LDEVVMNKKGVSVHTVLERIRSEYTEMPGMRLTAAQIQRFCGVDQRICAAVLDALVEARFLCRHHDGTYARVTEYSLHTDG
jgi:hypothetical protein